MWLIYIIDIVALVTLLAIALRRRVEDALPWAAFVFVLIPRDAAIQIPGLFDLTTQRIVLMALAVMYLVLPRSKGPSDLTRCDVKMADRCSHCLVCSLDGELDRSNP